MLKTSGLTPPPVAPATKSDAIGFLAQARAQLDAKARMQP
jgi:hypothetical protein